MNNNIWYFKTKSAEIIIDKKCAESDPCVHGIMINNVTKDMDGREICKLFQDLKIPVPYHFSEYVNEEDYGLFD